jgi:DNA-directed RNA polymerase specialized sigma subunit
VYDTEYLSEAVLWSLVKRFTPKGTGLNTRDDYMSEARAAAVFAVRGYDRAKNSSLEAFIVECVKNRLIDLHRKGKTEIKTEELGDEGFYESEHDLNFQLTMEQILTKDEYGIYHLHFVEDRSACEISRLLKIRKGDILACIHRIVSKYAKLDDAHLAMAARRRLQEKWLES